MARIWKIGKIMFKKLRNGPESGPLETGAERGSARVFALSAGKWFAPAHQPAPITPTRAFRVIFALAGASIVGAVEEFASGRRAPQGHIQP